MTRITKLIKPTLHVVVLVIINYIFNKNSIKLVQKIERFKTDLRHLLLWTNFPGLEEEGQTMFIKRNCLYINCYLTRNRNLLGNLRNFEAIIFNLEDVSKQNMELPTERSVTQIYIFAANDSADNYPICNAVYDKYFNATWTYKTDSTFPYKFVTVYDLKEKKSSNIRWMPLKDMKPINTSFKIHLQTKYKAAAIFLDRCKSNSKREQFLKRLQHELTKYNLTVDVFGNCSTLKCDHKGMQSCFNMLKTTYYFYLALEDSISADFITDTVLNGYTNNAVPIVYGGAEYSTFLPPSSYLDATHIGESDVAKTMNEILHNKDSYYDFFRWRNHYVIKRGAGMDVCKLCIALNDRKFLKYHFNVATFRKLWNPDFEKRCDK